MATCSLDTRDLENRVRRLENRLQWTRLWIAAVVAGLGLTMLMAARAPARKGDYTTLVAKEFLLYDKGADPSTGVCRGRLAYDGNGGCLELRDRQGRLAVSLRVSRKEVRFSLYDKESAERLGFSQDSEKGIRLGLLRDQRTERPEVGAGQPDDPIKKYEELLRKRNSGQKPQVTIRFPESTVNVTPSLAAVSISTDGLGIADGIGMRRVWLGIHPEDRSASSLLLCDGKEKRVTTLRTSRQGSSLQLCDVLGTPRITLSVDKDNASFKIQPADSRNPSFGEFRAGKEGPRILLKGWEGRDLLSVP